MQQFHNILATLLHLRNKVHVAHWYINGDDFYEMHKLYNKQYNTLLDLADRVAEFMIMNDMKPCRTLTEVIEHSLLADNGDVSIRSLCEDYDILDKFINKIPSSKDRVQENLLAIVQEQVEKYRWFLDATLGK